MLTPNDHQSIACLYYYSVFKNKQISKIKGTMNKRMAKVKTYLMPGL